GNLLFAPLRLCGKLLFAPLLFLVLAVPGTSQPRRQMQPADVVRVATVADAQISPNGQFVVYTVSTVADDKTVNTLWIARVIPEITSVQPTAQPTPRPPSRPNAPYVEWPDIRVAPRMLLPSGWSASNPRWSPDGNTIAYLSQQDEQDGLWVVRLDKPEPRFIASITSTNFFITYAGEPFSWSADSKRIAYISARAETPVTPDRGRGGDDPRVIDRIQYKSRTGFSDNRRTHVWVVDVDRPVPLQLTSGAFYDHAVSFSPRGDEVVFLSNHESDPDALNNSDIFAVDLGGQTRQITQTKGCEYDPVWSPDGRSIAYTATKRDVTTIDSVAEDTHLWVVAATGGNGKELTTDQDRRVRDPRWSADGRSIMYLAGDQGYTTIFRVGEDGGKISRFSVRFWDGQLVGGFTDSDAKVSTATNAELIPPVPFQITSFSFSHRSQTIGREISFPFVVTFGTAVRPAEIWAGYGSPYPMRRLSAHNESLMRSLRLVVPEEINYQSFDGTPIQGWVMRPNGCSSDRKCPLILSVHGGPHGMYGWSFNPTFQAYVARGYGVLYLNPRGSSGYGQKFSDGTLNEWGGGDYRDLMFGVDEALRRNPWIDGARLGVTGGSYGGFMTNWIVTQTPRFRAGVAVASVSNLISFYSTSVYQDLIHAEFGGFPWDNFEVLWEWSPLRFVRQVQTPTMFIHGELDNDVHITQAEEMYMALKRRGVETLFVRYPREGHSLREPKHRIDALERTLAWFDRFVK
ncbi:MAG TPA: S9 family peptidase, partial [Pyrinomonadaceae bacterium]|nr:S9 family peptidase [Pyrinomonadaceae bacterium]